MAIEVPFPVQAEVLAKHLAGLSKTRIASDLGMSRNTITKILDESEIERLSQESKTILLNVLPDSARTIAEAVKKKTADAWELLDRTSVMPKASETSANLNIGLTFAEFPSPYARVIFAILQQAIPLASSAIKDPNRIA